MAIRSVATIGDRASGRNVISAADGTARYAKLRQDVVAAGILDREYRYYAVLVAAIIAGMAVSGYFVLRLPVSVSLVLWAGVFAFFAVQVCGVIHDAGHRTIFKSTALNNAIGKASTGLLGMGFDSWRIRHNIHHAHTNEEDKDPDLDIPLHAFTVKQFQSQRTIFRYVRRHQAIIFVPMRVLVVFTRRLSEIEYFRSQPIGPRLVAQIMLWTLGIVVWFIAPFLLFPLAKAILVLAVVHICMGFYLSNVFAPNHKGMPQIRKGAPISFLEQQIITSRNVRPNWLTDIVYMGLNYQIEHHLFPSCPRNKLKRITPYVLEICRETGIEYTETGILESNRIVLGELNRIAKTASG